MSCVRRRCTGAYRWVKQNEERAIDTEAQSDLAALLREAGRAHHNAFLATDGDDADWPLWYANFIQQPLREQLGIEYTRSRLVYCLINADYEHQAQSPDSDWSTFYAEQILERCAPSDTPAEDKLALYHFNSCPFCGYARAGIERLGIDVELRDIMQNPEYRDELIKARGRATVPVLRITSPDGEEHWMPESRDIVAYLEKSYGDT